MDKDYKVSKKNSEGKWVNFGTVKKNQFGNYALGIKNTPEFKALVNSSAEWLNFSLFEDKPKEANPLNDGNEYVDSSQEIPF